MKNIGVNFSARKYGNCTRVGEYIGECIPCDMELVRISEFLQNPCGMCDYECASGKECSIQDGLTNLTERLQQAEKIYFFLPTYNGHFPSTYYMFMERMSPFFHEEEEMKRFLSKLSVIYIGNHGNGAERLIEELHSMYEEYKLPPRVLLIASKEYGKKAIGDDLLEVAEVKERINQFVIRTL